MKRSFYILIVFCLLFTGTVRSDVRIEGIVLRQFSISNIDKYAGYKFYYTYQSYHYDKGYHANPRDTIAVEINQRYAAASRGSSKTNLLASDEKGRWVKAYVEMGGEASVNPSMSGIVDVYQIVSIKNGVIKLKKIKEISIYKDGTEKQQKAAAGFMSFLGNDKFTGGLAIVSLIALLFLLGVFFWRKRQQQYLVMAT